MKYDSLDRLYAALGVPGATKVGEKDVIIEVTEPARRAGAEPTVTKKVSPDQKDWILQPAGGGAPVTVRIRTTQRQAEPGVPESGTLPQYEILGEPSRQPPAPPAPDVTSPGETTWIPNPNDPTTEIGGRIVNGTFVPNQVNGQPQTRPKPAATGAAAAQTSTSEIHWTRSKANSDLDQGNVIVGTTLTPVQGLLRPHDEKAPTVTPAGSLVYTDAGDGKEQGNIVVNGALVPVQGAVRTKEAPKPDVATEGQVIWQDIPDTDQEQAVRIVNGERVPVEGLTRTKQEATTLIGGADSEYWTFVDKQGNVVRTVKNEHYKPPPGTALTPDLIAPNIPILQPDGTVKWVPNNNRVPAGPAMQDLLASVGVKVNGGELSMADAKDMLTGAVNVMNAETSRANTAANVLSTERTFQTAAATVGENLMANRATATNTLLNNILSGAGGLSQGSAGRYGTIGGGLQAPLPAGFGAGLVSGAMGVTGQQFGGQETLDAAARMVRGAAPGAELTPQGQTAVGVLQQAFDRYKQLNNGVDHPAVAATTAANQSATNNGVTAPVTVQDQAIRAAAAQQAQARAAVAQAMPPPSTGAATPVGNVPGTFPPEMFTAPQTAAPTIVINA